MVASAIAISETASPATTISARITSMTMLLTIKVSLTMTAVPVSMTPSGLHRALGPASLPASSLSSDRCEQRTS